MGIHDLASKVVFPTGPAVYLHIAQEAPAFTAELGPETAMTWVHSSVKALFLPILIKIQDYLDQVQQSCRILHSSVVHIFFRTFSEPAVPPLRVPFWEGLGLSFSACFPEHLL